MESSVLRWHPSWTRTPLSVQFGWQSLRTVQWCRCGEMGMWARAKHDGRAPARLFFFFFDFQSCLTIHPLTRLCQMPPPNIVMPKIHPSCKLCVTSYCHGFPWWNSSRLYYVFVFSQLRCMIARVFVHWYSDEWFHRSNRWFLIVFCNCFCVSNHLFCQKRVRISSSPLLSVTISVM